LALVAGLSLGVATLVRGTTQLFPLFLLAVFRGLAVWLRGGFRHLLASGALLLVGTSAVVLPGRCAICRCSASRSSCKLAWAPSF
jgi:hypothetical protein